MYKIQSWSFCTQKLQILYYTARPQVSVLIVGLSYGTRNVVSYTTCTMKIFLSFRDRPFIPLRRSPHKCFAFSHREIDSVSLADGGWGYGLDDDGSCKHLCISLLASKSPLLFLFSGILHMKKDSM